VGTLFFAMLKGVAGTLKVCGPGLKLEECVKYTYKLPSDDAAVWMTVLKVCIHKLLNHANPIHTKVLFKEIEVSVEASYNEL
jgi:hypothetical protein